MPHTNLTNKHLKQNEHAQLKKRSILLYNSQKRVCKHRKVKFLCMVADKNEF